MNFFAVLIAMIYEAIFESDHEDYAWFKETDENPKVFIFKLGSFLLHYGEKLNDNGEFLTSKIDFSFHKIVKELAVDWEYSILPNVGDKDKKMNKDKS